MDNNIGEARREYADKVGRFTQEDAARFFDVSLSTYKKWEQGQGMMNGNQLKSIAAKYGVTVDYLLQIETPKPAVALPSDESRLLAMYRAMEPEYRELLLKTAAAYAAASEKDGPGLEVPEGSALLDAVR